MATATTNNESAVEEFVTKLKARMASLKMKPTELAEKASVGYPYLYRVLKGEQTPSLDWASRVGRCVGLKISTVEVEKRIPKKVS
jgi:predicted transcriptional regulator